MAKKQKKLIIRTGTIARKINLSGAVSLFFVFIILNLVLFFIDYHAGTEAYLIGKTNIFRALGAAFSTQKFIILMRAEGILLILKLIFGSGALRRQLKPIDELADVAFQLGTQSSDLDDEKFQRLEAAIDNIIPTAESAHLHTGDQQLAGLELAVNNLIERMRESYSQQARFVSDASHELRTPIAVIKGYADMLDRWGKTDEKVLTESIEAIKTESEHMNYLVEQLLFLARSDNGKTKMEFLPFDLGDMIRDVYDEYTMIDHEHVYSCDAREAVPVRGDISMLKQTARILLDNAKKYTPEGGSIHVSAGLVNNTPSFTIQDSGIGIEKDSLPHIFERFYRADSSRSRGTGGTGLGLAIARWIVTKHNGSFEVLSREGLGTRITVFLPTDAPANQLMEKEPVRR